MRENQRKQYVERIERVLSFLQRAVQAGDVPGLSRLAREANMSDYHFHRVYRLLTGETPQETTTRLRLASSLPTLASQGLGAAADTSGYASEQAYHRALKTETGEAAGELRRDRERLEAVKRSLSTPVNPMPSGRSPALTIEITDLEPLRLLAIRNVGDYAELNAGYGALFGLLSGQIAPNDIHGIYGIPHDDPRFTAGAACRFDCAFDTGAQGLPCDGVEEIRVAGGMHASLAHRGDFDLLHGLIDDLYAWVLNEGYAIAQRPLFIHYLDDPDETPPDEQRAIVHLPLEPWGAP